MWFIYGIAASETNEGFSSLACGASSAWRSAQFARLSAVLRQTRILLTGTVKNARLTAFDDRAGDLTGARHGPC
jgi:hypothetical protein